MNSVTKAILLAYRTPIGAKAAQRIKSDWRKRQEARRPPAPPERAQAASIARGLPVAGGDTIHALSRALGLDCERLRYEGASEPESYSYIHSYIQGFLRIELHRADPKPWRASILGRQFHEAETLAELRRWLQLDILSTIEELAELGRRLGQ